MAVEASSDSIGYAPVISLIQSIRTIFSRTEHNVVCRSIKPRRTERSESTWAIINLSVPVS